MNDSTQSAESLPSSAIDSPTISVVTATYNAAAHLPNLIESLRAQTDQDFEWVVADGGSTDGTVELLKAVTDLRVRFTSQPDAGIYDAMNRAVRSLTSTYYVTIGADDRFYPGAIAGYRAAAQRTGADLIAAQVDSEAGRLKIREGQAWFYAAKALVAAHSVGTLIRCSLHERFGFYSLRLPVTADALFLKKAYAGGAARYVDDFVAGHFSAGGVSNTAVIDGLIDGLKVQLATEPAKMLQLGIFVLRMVKNRRRMGVVGKSIHRP